MKPRWDDNEFNTPEEMLVRTTFLLCLTAFTAGVLLLLAGAATHELRLAIAGLLSLLISGLTRSWLRRHGKLDEADIAFQGTANAEESPHDARITELVRLLQLWEELENKRGSPGFDPWAVQAVRHDIRQMVDADPMLERLFRGSRRAA
jgi:hypothetical protein